MTMFFVSTLYGGCIFLLFLFLHVLVWRNCQRKGVLLLWGIAAITWIVSTASILLLRIPWGMPSLWASFFLYAFLLIAYTRFYITITRTLTLRFLEELLLVSGNEMKEDAFRALYPPQHAFRIRLHMLEKHRWIVRESDRYTPTAKCMAVGYGIRILRCLYGIRGAG